MFNLCVYLRNPQERKKTSILGVGSLFRLAKSPGLLSGFFVFLYTFAW